MVQNAYNCIMVDTEHEEWLRAQKEQEEKRFGWRAKLPKDDKETVEERVVKKTEVAEDEEEEEDDDDDVEGEEENSENE